MANEIDEGGYVYPETRNENVAFWFEGSEKPPDNFQYVRYPGITRRDWLAGLAMQGILSNPLLMDRINNSLNADIEMVSDHVTVLSLNQADAMIKKSNLRRKP